MSMNEVVKILKLSKNFPGAKLYLFYTPKNLLSKEFDSTSL